MMRFAAFPARRGGAKSTTWWGRAWLNVAEESAYDDADVAAGWRLARAGVVGGIVVDPATAEGAVTILASVLPRGGEPVACSVLVRAFDAGEREALVEAVAAESGRVGALLAGQLPESLVEHLEEAGVELLPDGFDPTCTCTAWVQPCAHALAVLAQVAWLVDADPLVLFALRGVDRGSLLDRLAGAGAEPRDDGGDEGVAEVDLDLAADAAQRAARLLTDLG